MYLPRTLETRFKEASRQFPVLLVIGARQVGKTTFLRHASEPERTYVTLDDPLVLALAKSDPALFMREPKRDAVKLLTNSPCSAKFTQCHEPPESTYPASCIMLSSGALKNAPSSLTTKIAFHLQPAFPLFL